MLEIVFANQVVLDRLISPKQTCIVKGSTSQDNFHLVRTIIEKVGKLD